MACDSPEVMRYLKLACTLTIIFALAFGAFKWMTDNAIDDAMAQGAQEARDAGPEVVPDAPPLPFHETVAAPDINKPLVVVKTIKDFNERNALWATVGLCVFLSALLLGNTSKEWAVAEFLRHGRWPAIIGMVAGVSGSVVDYSQGHVSYMAILLAIAAGLGQLLSPKAVKAEPKPA